MYNREKTYSDFPLTKDVKAATSISQEGLLLIQELVSGKEVVLPASGLGSEKIAGFSSMTFLTPSQEVIIKSFVVPATSPYTIDVGQTGLVSGQAFIPGLTLGVASNAGEFSFTGAGVFTFNVAQAGTTVEIHYKRDLTVAEAKQKYFEGHINNINASAAFKQVGLLAGKGIIYTDQYDVSKDYSTGTLKTLAGGLITIGGSGTDLSALMKVIETPSIGQPYLGLEFNI